MRKTEQFFVSKKAVDFVSVTVEHYRMFTVQEFADVLLNVNEG
jgi:hypothetical protein